MTVGMFKCKKDCVICPYIKLVKQVKSKKTGEIIKMTHKFDCNTTGVIYMSRISPERVLDFVEDFLGGLRLH